MGADAFRRELARLDDEGGDIIDFAVAEVAQLRAEREALAQNRDALWEEVEALRTEVARLIGMLETVGRLRVLQRRYFKAREPAVLIEAKQLEREVDAALVAEGWAASP